MEKNNSDIFIICGERSGDLHGSHLIKKLLNENSSLKIHCWGGEMMQKAGGILLEDYKNYNLMGFWEVLKGLRSIYKAWNRSRAVNLSKYVDKIYSILPFEIDFFRKYNCNIEYVGNPITQYIPKDLVNKKNTENVISLLPGSRNSELKYSVPIFKQLIEVSKDYIFKVCAVDNVDQKLYNDFKNYDNVEIVNDDTYRVVALSKLSIVMSGTASLEVAYTGIPQVVVYKTSFLSFFIAKLLINVKFISLVNLILNKKLVNELIQNDFNHNNLLKEIKHLEDSNSLDKFLSGYKKLREVVGNKNALDKVKENIIKSL